MVKKIVTTSFLITSFLITSFLINAEAQKITDEAHEIYNKYKSSIYQIRVIDSVSGEKSAIGSGFQFSQEGHIATNYHVVSSAVLNPLRYRVEYIRENGSKGILNILDIDIIHDLAIVKSGDVNDSYLHLKSADLSKGMRIFSMGNPYDLGMVVVEGTYNGYIERSLYPKILFSGSLNPGMSGGPALGHDGEVVGVNVSTAGNEISFIVPAGYLKNMYDNLRKGGGESLPNWDKLIEKQLIDNQLNLIDELLASKWDKLSVGDAQVPGEISKIFKCWADSKNYTKDKYKSSYVYCSCEESLFLSSDFYTGTIIYKYNFLENQGLNSIRFYNLYQNYFTSGYNYDNVDKQDASDFKCNVDFIRIGRKDWKVSLCARQYNRFQELYDINLRMASLNSINSGLLVEAVMLGVSRNKTLEFIKKFITEVK